MLVLRTSNQCIIADLPEYVNVTHIIETSSSTFNVSNKEEKYILQAPTDLRGSEKQKVVLFTEALEQCHDKQTINTQSFEIEASLHETYSKGEVIKFGSKRNLRNCETV